MIDREISIKIAPRPDGGIRIWSDDLPGLVLSGTDQKAVLLDVSSVLIGLLEHPMPLNK